jgi:biopolymer transport protein ExbB
MNESLGFAHFLAQTDGVGRIVLFLLLALSLASWYLIVTKSLANVLAGRRAAAFLRRFWEAGSLAEARQMLETQGADNAFAEAARQALGAAKEDRAQQGLHRLAAAGGLGEYLTRVLRNAIDQEAARVEHGLTVMASTASAAPFIGLFGTVWGIYHALVQIGMSGQGTLDKVAGPVGEALIMTALGLVVAIPAVLAYNAFNRRNRIWLARLDAFAHDLYALITVGTRANGPAGEARQLRAAVAR